MVFLSVSENKYFSYSWDDWKLENAYSRVHVWCHGEPGTEWEIREFQFLSGLLYPLTHKYPCETLALGAIGWHSENYNAALVFNQSTAEMVTYSGKIFCPVGHQSKETWLGKCVSRVTLNWLIFTTHFKNHNLQVAGWMPFWL